jgi:hypothetical protein
MIELMVSLIAKNIFIKIIRRNKGSDLGKNVLSGVHLGFLPKLNSNRLNL